MDKGMSNDKILQICSTHLHTKPFFQGVYAVNKLDHVTITKDVPYFLIVNTSPDTVKTSGHWTVIWHDETYEIQFFCSMGYPPTGAILNFIKELSSEYTYNKHRYQAYNSASCGPLSLFYCDVRAQGFSNEDALETLSTTNLKLNDCLAKTYVYGHMTSP